MVLINFITVFYILKIKNFVLKFFQIIFRNVLIFFYVCLGHFIVIFSTKLVKNLNAKGKEGNIGTLNFKCFESL